MNEVSNLSKLARPTLKKEKLLIQIFDLIHVSILKTSRDDKIQSENDCNDANFLRIIKLKSKINNLENLENNLKSRLEKLEIYEFPPNFKTEIEKRQNCPKNIKKLEKFNCLSNENSVQELKTLENIYYHRLCENEKENENEEEALKNNKNFQFIPDYLKFLNVVIFLNPLSNDFPSKNELKQEIEEVHVKISDFKERKKIKLAIKESKYLDELLNLLIIIEESDNITKLYEIINDGLKKHNINLKEGMQFNSKKLKNMKSNRTKSEDLLILEKNLEILNNYEFPSSFNPQSNSGEESEMILLEKLIILKQAMNKRNTLKNKLPELIQKFEEHDIREPYPKFEEEIVFRENEIADLIKKGKGKTNLILKRRESLEEIKSLERQYEFLIKLVPVSNKNHSLKTIEEALEKFLAKSFFEFNLKNFDSLQSKIEEIQNKSPLIGELKEYNNEFIEKKDACFGESTEENAFDKINNLRLILKKVELVEDTHNLVLSRFVENNIEIQPNFDPVFKYLNEEINSTLRNKESFYAEISEKSEKRWEDPIIFESFYHKILSKIENLKNNHLNNDKVKKEKDESPYFFIKNEFNTQETQDSQEYPKKYSIFIEDNTIIEVQDKTFQSFGISSQSNFPSSPKEIYKMDSKILEIMEEYIKIMPIFCAERELIQLILKTYYNNIYHSNVTKEYRENLDLLKNLLKKEGLLDNFWEESIESWRLRAASKVWGSILIESLNALNKIRPLDILLLNSLVMKEESIISKLIDQDIMLFFGCQRSGKSTVINYLAGSKMDVLSRKLSEDYSFLTPPKNKDDSLREIKMSSPFKYEKKPIVITHLNKSLFGSAGTLYLCEFSDLDLDSNEIKITHEIILYNCIKKAKSVKPIFVLSAYDLVSGTSKLKDYLLKIIGMQINFNESIGFFSYYFTMFSEKMKKELKTKLEEFKAFQKAEHNSELEKLVENILLKTSKKTNFINPLIEKDGKSAPLNMLQELYYCPEISNPSLAFKPFFNEKSKLAINSQIRLMNDSIMHALDNKNYELIKFRLKMLSFIQKLIQQDEIQNEINKYVKEIEQKLQKEFHYKIQKLKNCILKEEILDDLELKEYFALEKETKLIEQFKEFYPELNLITFNDIEQELNSSIEKIHEFFFQFDCYNKKLKLKLEKLLTLKKYFNRAEVIYLKCIQEIHDFMIKAKENIKTFLKVHDFSNIAEEFFKLQKVRNDYKDLIDTEICEKCFQDCKIMLLSQLKHDKNEKEKILSKHSISHDDAIELNTLIIAYDKIIQIFSVKKILKINEVYDLKSGYINMIAQKFENIRKKIDEKIFSIKRNDLILKPSIDLPIQKEFEELEMVRKQIPAIEAKIVNNYHNTIIKLENFIENIVADVDILLKKLKNGEAKYLEHINKFLNFLKKILWIEIFLPEFYKRIKLEFGKKIFEFIEQIGSQIKKTPLSLENYKLIDQIAYQFDCLIKIQNLCKDLIGTHNSLEIVSKFFYENFKYVFKAIEQSFEIFQEFSELNLLVLDLEKLENSLNYLEICKSIDVLNEFKPNILFANFEKLIKDYLKNFEKNLFLIINFVISFKDGNVDILNNYIFSLEKYFQELQKFKKNDLFYKIFDPDKDSTSSKIKKLVKVLSEMEKKTKNELRELSAGNLTKEYSALLTKVKSLIILDKYFSEMEKTYVLKFASIYDEFHPIYLSFFVDVGHNMNNAIGDLNFDLIYSQLDSLKEHESLIARDFLNSFKFNLNFKIQELAKKTNHQAKFFLKSDPPFNHHDLQTIISKLRSIEEALIKLKIYLKDIKAVEKIILNTKRILNKDLIDILDSIKNLFDNKEFATAQRRIKEISPVIDILDEYCEENVKQTLLETKIRGNKKIQEVIALFKQYNIEDYPKKPPKQIIENLNKDNQNKNAVHEICFHIREQFTGHLRLIEYSRNNNKIKEKEIKNLELKLNFLPNFLREEIQIMITHSKENIQHEKINHMETLKKIISKNSLEELDHFIKMAKDNGEFEVYKPDIATFLDKQIMKLRALHLNKKENFKELEYLLFLKSILSADFQKISNFYDLIKKDFNLHFHSVMNTFCELKDNNEIIANKQKIDTNFNELITLVNFRNEKNYLIKELIQDFDEYLIEFLSLFIETMKEINNEFYVFLGNLNFQDLARTMNKMKIRDGTLQNILENIHIFQTFEIKELEQLKKINGYEKNLNFLQDKFKEILYEFNTNDFSKEDLNLYQKREEFFRMINEFLAKIAKVFYLKEHLPLSKSIKEDFINNIRSKMHNLANLTSQILAMNKLSSNQYEILNKHFFIFSDFEKFIEFKIFDGKMEASKILMEIERRLENLKLKSKQFIPNEKIKFIENIFEIQSLKENLVFIKDKAFQCIEGLLEEFKNQKGSQSIALLGKEFEKHQRGKTILDDYKIFEGYNILLFNQKTLKFGIDYVLSNVTGTDLNVEGLRKKYEDFHETFKYLITENLNLENNVAVLIKKLYQILEPLKLKGKKLTTTIYSQIPLILAHIFAIWTLLNSKHFFDSGSSQEDGEGYLFQPHPAQVIAIFRILGIGDDKEELVNNFAQIKTGEGKSLTLAVLSTIFALLGFNVSCACYSKYLSDRDFKSFELLFKSLNISDYIKYGTFNHLCENFINKNGDIRKMTENLFKEGKLMKKSEITINRPNILLIDEVDVFFSPDFYGNLYTPVSSIKHPKIENLLILIWDKRNERNLNIDTINKSNEYQELIEAFPKWKDLVDEIIKSILQDVKNFEEQTYEIDHESERIGYKDQDHISFNKIIGYKTLFLYFKEFYTTRNFKNKEKFLQNISLNIKYGSFSYAEIPKKIDYIMGVTGTLDTLQDFEKRVIREEYKIYKETYLPSVFGQSNFQFSENFDVFVESIDSYHIKIINEITNKLNKRGIHTPRAVLVFFESKNYLEEFYNSNVFRRSQYASNVEILTESANHDEKENTIRKATQSGRVTLLTKAFGRGTDFKCRDPIVIANDGVHVLQTFLSEEPSEEIQIKGRTARQGDYGSYSMILLDKHLEKFLIRRNEIDAAKDKIYASLLKNKRIEFFQSQYETNKKFVVESQRRHKRSMEFLELLISNEKSNGNEKKILEFLIDQNKGLDMPKLSVSKTVCVMDATGSMNRLLQKCKANVNRMYDRIIQILKEYGLETNCFQLQFVVYRNYDQKENGIMQCSQWETSSDNLRNFMETISASGGHSPGEAIEIGLWQANQEKDVNQVILIGDCHANSPNEVIAHRQNIFGESYWKTTKFKESTDYITECKKLCSKKIPVHCFYVYKNQNVRQNFQEIAKLTGGKCCFMDVNSSNGAEILTNIVSSLVLQNVGNQNGGKGQELLNEYAKRYNFIFKMEQ